MNTICQSCGMPLDFMELRGTEKDGRKSDDYCMYCYKDCLLYTSDAADE